VLSEVMALVYYKYKKMRLLMRSCALFLQCFITRTVPYHLHPHPSRHHNLVPAPAS